MSTSRSKPKTEPTLDDITEAITPAEKIVSICVAGSLYAEHQRLEDELEEIQAESSSRMNGGDKARAIAKRIVAVEDEMRAKTFEFTVRQIGRLEWREMLADHQTQGAPVFGMFAEELRPAAVRASTVKPAMDDEEKFKRFWDKIGAGQDVLFQAAWDVNQVGVSVPFSAAASVLLRPSVPSSNTAAE